MRHLSVLTLLAAPKSDRAQSKMMILYHLLNKCKKKKKDNDTQYRKSRLYKTTLTVNVL